MLLRKLVIHLSVILLGVAACQSPDPTPFPTETADFVPTPNTLPTDTTSPPTADPTPIPASPTTGPTIDEDPPATDTPPTPETVFQGWPPPLPAKDHLSRDPVTEAQQTAAAQLLTHLPLERDDVALAMAYKGLATRPALTAPLVTDPLPLNTRQQVNIHNTDLNTMNRIEVVLLAVSDHAYFWFDTTPGMTTPTEAVLAATGTAFDTIYEQSNAFFGSENNPGIDGDPRIHIMNVSPLSVCDVTEATAHQCGLGGYYASNNTLPISVDEQSNEREMFVMNSASFGTNRYLDVLAHEFRHMIEDNYDGNDIDWEVEGSAMLAEDLLGFASDPIRRANQFLTNPDQQLNRWTDGNTTPYYGQGYLLNRYIFNRLGPDLYFEFATHPEPGLLAIDAVAAANDLALDGLTLWLDWLTAVAIHNEPGAPQEYLLREGIDTVSMTALNDFPTTINSTVSQYAADYYKLFGSGHVTLTFTGSSHTQLLQTLPASGDHMWVANRANYSQMQLTHVFDLSGVSQATLTYAVYHAIEAGYDFAYLSISTDDGQTWQPLTADNMQGLDPSHNPGDSALTDRFYTGNSVEWMLETADLTPYTGQTVHIRFEYVTDPILTFGGLALDNISIPEIGFYDDAETDTGWTADGFVRATGYIPQQWHIQLITFADGVPVIQPLFLEADQTASHTFSLNNDGGGRPILIIAARAPMTLESAHYELTLQP